MMFEDERLQDFRSFLWLAWKTLGLPEPTKCQYDMAGALQGVVKHHLLGMKAEDGWSEKYGLLSDDGVPAQRIVLQAFRGVGKSWISSALVDWALAMRPDINCLVVSAAKGRADEYSQFCKRLILEMDVLEPLKPDFDKGQRYSNVAFDVGPAPASHAPSVKSVDVLGQMAGSRADLVIADDVEVPNTAETQTMREKLSERVKEFDAILKPGGIVIYLGTPQTEDTLYTQLESRGYRRIIWPSRYPTQGWDKGNGYALAPMVRQEVEEDESLREGGGLDGKLGKPVDFERFNETDLQEREASYGRSGFSLQFMLDTTLSDADRYVLKLNDLMVMDLDPAQGPEQAVWASSPELVVEDVPTVGFRGDKFHRPWQIKGDMIPYTGKVMSIDPAGRGKDELAYSIVNQLNGKFFVMECRGLKGGFVEKNLTLLANRAKHWGVNLIISEPNYGGGMFVELLRPILGRIYPCQIEDAEWSKIQKEKRIIQSIEPALNQHRIVINKKVILDDVVPHPDDSSEYRMSRQLFYQMTRLTSQSRCLRHDDRLDALAMAISYWTKSAAIDSVKRAGDREWKETKKIWRDRLRNRSAVRIKQAPPPKPNFLRK